METKFMRVLATLGIPGVALGIFYLLLKALNFQFSKVSATWTAAIVILFLLIVAIITLFALHRWSPVKPKEGYINKNTIVNTKDHSKATQSTESIENDRISSLTVKHIIDQINESPPFQRDGIAHNYRGIKVKWEGKLWDVEKSFRMPSGNVRVDIKPEPDSLNYSVLFDVPISKYPQLKIARRDDLIGIVGRITACSGTGMYVKLDVDEITFHNS